MKSRIWLCCLVLVCALLQITLVILDEFNPLMGCLTAAAPKLFLCAFSVLALILSISGIVQAKKK